MNPIEHVWLYSFLVDRPTVSQDRILYPACLACWDTGLGLDGSILVTLPNLWLLRDIGRCIYCGCIVDCLTRVALGLVGKIRVVGVSFVIQDLEYNLTPAEPIEMTEGESLALQRGPG